MDFIVYLHGSHAGERIRMRTRGGLRAGWPEAVAESW
jgi:hypothetical protein